MCVCESINPGERMAVSADSVIRYNADGERDAYYDELRPEGDVHEHDFYIHPESEHLSDSYSSGGIVVLERTDEDGYSHGRWDTDDFDPDWWDYLWRIVEGEEEEKA